MRDRITLALPQAASMIAIVVAPIVASHVWKVYLQAAEITPIFNLSRDALIARLQSPTFGTHLLELSTRYLNALAGARTINQATTFSLPAWLCLIGAIAAGSFFAQPPASRARILLANILMSMGLMAYAAMLWFFYAFAFRPADALTLPSFGRYIGCYILAWLLLAIVMLVAPPIRRAWLATVVLLIVAGALVLKAPPYATAGLREGPRGPSERGYLAVRQTVQERLVGINAVPKNARIYIVWSHSTGLPFYMSHYEVAPRRTNRWCWAMGPRRFEGDLWSCDQSAEEFAKTLRGYEYVFLGEADALFWERYGHLFSARVREFKSRLLKVGFADDGIVIQPIEQPDEKRP
jgi:hypothetical protein